jgi:hypothetical protein
MWDFPNLYTSISINCGEYKMQFMTNGFKQHSNSKIQLMCKW